MSARSPCEFTPPPPLLLQSLNVCVPYGLFKWVSALHSARVTMCTRAEVFVCSISFIYQSTDINPRLTFFFLPARCVLSPVCLNFCFVLHSALASPLWSIHPSPKLPRQESSGDADKLSGQGGKFPSFVLRGRTETLEKKKKTVMLPPCHSANLS